MRFQCEKCNAKYNIDDAKLTGKTEVKVRCKKCNNIIALHPEQQKPAEDLFSIDSIDNELEDQGKDQELSNNKSVSRSAIDRASTRLFGSDTIEKIKQELDEEMGSKFVESVKEIQAGHRTEDKEQTTSAEIDRQEEKWHVAIGEEQVGPVNIDTIEEMLQKGDLDEQSFVWCSGFDDWQIFKEVEELNFLLEPGEEDSDDLQPEKGISGDELSGKEEEEKPADQEPETLEADIGSLLADELTKDEETLEKKSGEEPLPLKMKGTTDFEIKTSISRISPADSGKPPEARTSSFTRTLLISLAVIAVAIILATGVFLLPSLLDEQMDDQNISGQKITQADNKKSPEDLKAVKTEDIKGAAAVESETPVTEKSKVWKAKKKKMVVLPKPVKRKRKVTGSKKLPAPDKVSNRHKKAGQPQKKIIIIEEKPKKTRRKRGTRKNVVTPKSLNYDHIKSIVKGNLYTIQKCTELNKRSTRPFSGTIIMYWLIQPHGGVDNVTTEDKSLAKTTLGRCLINAISRWHFRQFNGPPIPIKFPFKF